jgi:hypothetical protein
VRPFNSKLFVGILFLAFFIIFCSTYFSNKHSLDIETFVFCACLVFFDLLFAVWVINRYLQIPGKKRLKKDKRNMISIFLCLFFVFGACLFYWIRKDNEMFYAWAVVSLLAIALSIRFLVRKR